MMNMNANEQAWDRWTDAIDQIIAETGNPSRADAAAIARQRHPQLAAAVHGKAPGYTGLQMQASGPARGSGSAEAQLNALAKQIVASKHIAFAQAYVEALNANPALYVAYLREHEAALETRRA